MEKPEAEEGRYRPAPADPALCCQGPEEVDPRADPASFRGPEPEEVEPPAEPHPEERGSTWWCVVQVSNVEG